MKKQVKSTEATFTKVGRISMTVARQAHIKAADVVIDRNHLRHIDLEHGIELQKLAINAFDYVRIVLAQFTEIRLAERNAVLVVKKNEDSPSDTVTIELTLNDKKHRWEVRTAQPRRNVSNNKLLWIKGNGKPKSSP